MKFEVRYPLAAPHVVELQGTVAVLGRDPSCDLVLSDTKCSRRHAVLEAGPQGIVIRDSGSANGVFVNDKKVERKALDPGDVIRLGDVVLKVLPEEMPGTLMMGPEDMETPAPGAAAPPAASPKAPAPASSPPVAAEDRGPAPARPRPEPRARPAAARPLPRVASGRPLTVTLLAGLWMASVLLYGVGGVLAARAWGLPGFWAALPVAAGAMLALVSAAMAYGLWTLSPWARVLQIFIAALGVLVCPFTFASIAVLFYMARPATRSAFSGARPGSGAASPGPDSSDTAYAAVLVGTVLLGALASAASLFFAFRNATGMEQARSEAREEAAVERLRKLAAAESEFHAGTCGNAYADLQGLLDPRTAIPNYRPDGPAFLTPDFARAEAVGYRFDLAVEDPVPPTEGCAGRGFRRFVYTATPMDPGLRHLMVGADGVVHAARGRPAGAGDPAVR